VNEWMFSLHLLAKSGSKYSELLNFLVQVTMEDESYDWSRFTKNATKSEV